jgi:hypothetical protein
MDFRNVPITKVVHIYVRGHECIIYMIYNQIVFKTYLYLTRSVKLGIQNTKY